MKRGQHFFVTEHPPRSRVGNLCFNALTLVRSRYESITVPEPVGVHPPRPYNLASVTSSGRNSGLQHGVHAPNPTSLEANTTLGDTGDE